MKSNFIKIKDRIWDFETYSDEVRLLKNYLELEAKELLEKLGFVMLDSQKGRYDELNLFFHHSKLDLDIEVSMSRKSGDEFV